MTKNSEDQASHPQRRGEVNRETRETRIDVSLDLDGSRNVKVQTGLGFFDHMLAALAFHAEWNLKLIADGDLEVDDHHTIEDCGLAVGQAFDLACGDKRGIVRFGSAFAPLDEALARCVIDLSGRPSSVVDLNLKREMIGQMASENLTHFFQSLATAGKFTLHLDVLRGENDHHRAEAAFKAFALAINEATRLKNNMAEENQIPSTKGAL